MFVRTERLPSEHTGVDLTPFTREEYAERLRKILDLMGRERVDTLVLTDPCNILWLTGYDLWSFYVPQAVVVSPKLREPLWIGRGSDAPGIEETSWLSPDSVVAYTDDLVQIAGRHAGDFIAATIRDRGLARGVIGLELESFYLTPTYRDVLVAALPGAGWADLGLKVCRLRSAKSPAELEIMRQAALIAERAMTVGLEHMQLGVRECDVVGEVARAQYSGTPEYGGFHTSSPVYVLRGKRGAAPHLSWGQGRFQPDETAFIELLGSRYRYQVTVSRSVHFGEPPPKVRAAADASIESIERCLELTRPGVTCGELAREVVKVFAKHGIDKKSRSGYGVGIAFAPTSGERTMSLHPADETVLEAGMTLHLHPNITFEDWGLFITETMVVTDSGGKPFTRLPRELIIRK
jgi:ectoine hydrolase